MLLLEVLLTKGALKCGKILPKYAHVHFLVRGAYNGKTRWRTRSFRHLLGMLHGDVEFSSKTIVKYLIRTQITPVVVAFISVFICEMNLSKIILDYLNTKIYRASLLTCMATFVSKVSLQIEHLKTERMWTSAKCFCSSSLPSKDFLHVWQHLPGTFVIA